MKRNVYTTVALVSVFCFGTLGTIWSGSVVVAATDTMKTKVYFNEYHKEPETKSKSVNLLSLNANEGALIKRSLAEIKAARNANKEFGVERVVCTYSDNNNKEIVVTHRSDSKDLYVVHKEGGTRVSEKSVAIATV